MSRNLPIARLGRAYDEFRRDDEARFAFKGILGIVAGLIAIHLLIAFTDVGGAVWAWLAY